ncbi:hypothetical protein K0U73_03475 [bacterium]|mgnify:FL=1|jgi:hypothetical protein|nr:hypothetical protein [Acidimicrobiaceae bacterium]MCH9802841.1 hypothetical protein [bacterium]HAY68006.1 hypothetical protein [Acidimicrobiaceae bacterium]
MNRLAHLVSVLLFVALAAAACSGDPEPSPVPVDADGFPIDWPIAIPPGNVNDCDNGAVSQEDALFAVVMCLPDDPDPFAASENYLATLEGNGFVEREPGAFITQQQTFLDGSGIEIYFQLVGNEATVVLIKPA